MKKLIYFLAAGILLMPLACKKDGGDDPSSKKEFEKPTTKEFAAKLSIETNDKAPLATFPGESVSQPVEDVIFTEDGEVLLFGKNSKATPIKGRSFKTDVYFAKPATGSGSGSGSTDQGYTEYTIPSVGSFRINIPNKKVQFAQGTLKAETWVDLTVKELKAITTGDVNSSNLARTWTVSSIIITVKGGSLGSAGVKKEFTGCDLYDIAGWAKDKGVNISASDYAGLKGYKVSKVIFTGDKHLAIEFAGTNTQPYFGSWGFSGSSFSYTLENMEFDIMGSVSGSFVPDASSKTAQLKGSGKFSAQGTEFSGEVDIRLRAK